MPKTTKAAPPQQSSLHEMWGKKPTVGASKVQPDAIDLEIPKEKQGKGLFLESMMLSSTSTFAAVSSKRKEPPGKCVVIQDANVCLSVQ